MGRKSWKTCILCHSKVSLPETYFFAFSGTSEQFGTYEELIYSYKVDLISIYHPDLFSDRVSITFPD